MRPSSLPTSLVRGTRLYLIRALRRPKLSFFLILSFFLALSYCILWRVHGSEWGRYYYNYFASIHPLLLYVVPRGNWGPIERPPRWVQEIYDAPWMGEWDVPELSPPVYGYSSGSGDDQGSRLINPVIAKLHVFSTATEKGHVKRQLIRQLSPVRSVPKAYRHLFELKFVLGRRLLDNGELDQEMEDRLISEQQQHGDLLRLDLKNGENLREGKILRWIQAVGNGGDGGREAWWLFKIDDDTVPNLPIFLDTLLTLDPSLPYYLGTSLVRWPAYHHHFTGILTGFSWPLLKTLAAGIDEMSREDVETWWDDDVLTGELMFDLPSAPHCFPPPTELFGFHRAHSPPPDYCDPHQPPPWGYQPPPPSPDPRTGLIRYDFYRRMGDPGWFWLKGDVATHGWQYKPPEGYRREWEQRVKGKMWEPPAWLEQYADTRGVMHGDTDD